MNAPLVLSPAVADCLRGVRTRRPLVLNVTNLVVMNLTANALLAIGASPLMAHAPEELDELTGRADALVMNIGTLDALWRLSMRQAGTLAASHGVPSVLDPVGAGASALRTETAATLMRETGPAVVRGNASEIMAMTGMISRSKGADSLDDAGEALEAAEALAEEYGCVVSVSGPVDVVTDGRTVVRIGGGSPLMTRVTGMGCTATALTAACVAGAKAARLDAPALVGAVTAMCAMAEAGDAAAAACKGPGSFVPAFLDGLYALRPDDLGRHLR